MINQKKMTTYFTGNSVEHGGAPEDKQTVLVCPFCSSENNFMTKDWICICKKCWNKAPQSDFIQDADEYYGEAEAKNY